MGHNQVGGGSEHSESVECLVSSKCASKCEFLSVGLGATGTQKLSFGSQDDNI